MSTCWQPARAAHKQAMERASGAGYLLVVECLLSHGATDPDGRVLRRAANTGRLPIIDCLLAASINVHACDRQLTRLLMLPARRPIAECLLAAGADIHACYNGALTMASGSGRLLVVKHLIAAGADRDAGFVGHDALTCAIRGGHLPVVEYLLAIDAQTDVNEEPSESMRAALPGDHVDVAERLLAEPSVVPDAIAQHMMSLTMYEPFFPVKVVQMLLRRGANVATAWQELDGRRKVIVAPKLDQLGAAIPSDQRAILVQALPRRFPTLRAAQDAEQRRRTSRRANKQPG